MAKALSGPSEDHRVKYAITSGSRSPALRQLVCYFMDRVVRIEMVR
jgi:hypothetical protein